MGKKITKLVMCGLWAIVGLGTEACMGQMEPGALARTEGERTVGEDSNSDKSEGTTKTCEKNIREGVEPEILKVLDKLAKLGGTVKDLQADLILDKLETVVADRTIKEGRLYYQREKEKIRFRISFDTTRQGKRTRRDREDFVFVDGWLTHRQERGKREDRYQVTRPGQPSTDLMQIGKSPLPIPIGQKTEDVLKKFEVTLLEPNKKTDPAKIKTAHLKLVPRKGTKLAMSHTRLEFWLRELDGLPVRSQWENDSGDIFTADMNKLRVNKKMRKRVFKLPKLPTGYETKDHPLAKKEKEE